MLPGSLRVSLACYLVWFDRCWIFNSVVLGFGKAGGSHFDPVQLIRRAGQKKGSRIGGISTRILKIWTVC
jgi:hypothetical protein